jgi:hypothetical protein
MKVYRVYTWNGIPTDTKRGVWAERRAKKWAETISGYVMTAWSWPDPERIVADFRPRFMQER